MLIIDVSNITINEINNEIRKLANKLEYWLDVKEKMFSKTQPKSIEIKDESIEGGLRTDRFASYVIECEEKEIDAKINEIQDKISILTKYVEKELLRAGEYGKVEEQVITLRDVHKKKWRVIEKETNYSERQCIRIYQKYHSKRYIEDVSKCQ